MPSIRPLLPFIVAAVLAAGCGSGSDSVTDEIPVGSSSESASDTGSDSSTGSGEAAGGDDPESVGATGGADDAGSVGAAGSDSAAAAEAGLAWAPTALSSAADGSADGSDSADENVAAWAVEVLDVRPHDPSAFTQGLEVHRGTLLESTGGTGTSTARVVDVESGAVISSLDLDADAFGEGLTVAGDRILQLTWRNEVAYVRDLDTLAVVDQFGYDGEGWGICFDGATLVMSNGSAELIFRDPDTFAVIETVEVRLGDEPIEGLNELECVDGHVLANVWKSNTVVVIDAVEGRVVATIDATELMVDALGIEDDGTRVLNGIARLDETTFLLTGKFWPSMYLVRFVEAP